MAGQLMCDLCQAEPATVMQSNLGNGDTVAVGDGCALGFYLTVAATILEGMDEANVTAHSGYLEPIVKLVTGEPAPPAPPEKPARRRGRSPAATSSTPEGGEPSGQTPPSPEA